MSHPKSPVISAEAVTHWQRAQNAASVAASGKLVNGSQTVRQRQRPKQNARILKARVKIGFDYHDEIKRLPKAELYE
jgi:hypothetical protein